MTHQPGLKNPWMTFAVQKCQVSVGLAAVGIVVLCRLFLGVADDWDDILCNKQLLGCPRKLVIKWLVNGL